jgi:hypothetical protein
VWLRRLQFKRLCDDVTTTSHTQPENDIFVSLSAEQREQAFALLEKLILATDMALHQHFISSFKEIMNNGAYDINSEEHRQLVCVAHGRPKAH